VSAVYADFNLVQKFVIRNGRNEGRETGRKADKEREAKRKRKRKRKKNVEGVEGNKIRKYAQITCFQTFGIGRMNYHSSK
jgi:hypothetical protein